MCIYVKVVWENKGGVGDEKEIPHIIYISREKRPNYVHNQKCGAMNFLVNEFSYTSLSFSSYFFLKFHILYSVFFFFVVPKM